MKPAREFALFVVRCILVLAQLCPVVGEVVGVLRRFYALYFWPGIYYIVIRWQFAIGKGL